MRTLPLARVANFGLKVVLMEVAPGSERILIRNVKKKVKERSLGPFLIYRTFGKYDLMLLFESDFQSDFLGLGTFPGILSSTELLCFPWETNTTGFRTARKFLSSIKESILGISILKLDPFFLREYGILVEQVLANTLCQNGNRNFILGSLGWAELLVLVPGKKISAVYDDLIALADQAGKIPHTRTKGKIQFRNLILKSFSIIGLKDSTLRTLPIGNDEIFNAGDDSIPSPVLSISCDPEYMHDIKERLNKWYPDIKSSVCLGKFDIRIHITKGKWLEFVNRVELLRNQFKNGIFSTSIVPIGIHTASKGSIRPKKSPSAIIRLSKFNIERLRLL